MDGTELDEIMNGSDEPVVIENAVVETSPAETQPRDEAGKFAPKPVVAEGEPSPDVAAQDAVEGGEHAGGRNVPVAAIQAEREKARAARDEAETLRRQMSELQGQVKLLNDRGTQPATPKEQPKPKAFWEDPDAFFAERAAPLQQSIQQQKFEMSRMMAEDRLGADVVKAADDALGELIMANDPAVLAIQQRVMNSRHPYAELVKWHESHKAMADIGNDPTSYRSRVEAEVRAAVMAEYGIEQSAAQPAVTTPSTTKPLTKLPQSLSKIPGSGNGAGAVDMSDAGLFTDAMGGR